MRETLAAIQLPGWGPADLRPLCHGSGDAATLSCPWESLQTQSLPCRTQSHQSTETHRFGSSRQVREGKAGIRLASAAQGCTKGFHSKEKPPESFSQETSDKPKANPVEELIIQGPKSAEKMQRERPR